VKDSRTGKEPTYPKGHLSYSESIRLDERIKTMESVVNDMRKRLKKGLKPEAQDGPDGGTPAHWNPDHVKAQEQFLQSLINTLAYKTNQLRAVQRKSLGKRR
jgi:hypothetical protein